MYSSTLTSSAVSHRAQLMWHEPSRLMWPKSSPPLQYSRTMYRLSASLNVECSLMIDVWSSMMSTFFSWITCAIPLCRCACTTSITFTAYFLPLARCVQRITLPKLPSPSVWPRS